MAISVVNRGNSSGSGFSRSLSAFTPANGSLLVAVYQGCYHAAGSPLTNASVSGGGLTWTKRAEVTHDWFGNERTFVTIWTAPVATGASTTVAASNSGASSDGTMLACFELTGQHSSPIGATATGSQGTTSDTTFSMNLSAAPASDSWVVAGAVIQNWENSNPITNGTGWTEVYESATGSSTWSQVQTRTGSTSQAVAWGTLNVNQQFGASEAFAALEIKVAAGTTVTSTGATTAPHATASGTAVRSMPTTGAAAAPHATASGSAVRQMDATGTTTAPPATGSGAATRAMDAEGVTTSGAATGAGTAEREITTSGATTAPSATGEGEAAKGLIATGVTSAPASTGSGQAIRAMDGTGATTAPATIGQGSATRSMDTTGDTSAPSATADGEAAVSSEGEVTSVGATTAPIAGGAGSVSRATDTTGDTTAPAATGEGAAVRSTNVTGATTAPVASGSGQAATGAAAPENPYLGTGGIDVPRRRKPRWTKEQREAWERQELARLRDMLGIDPELYEVVEAIEVPPAVPASAVKRVMQTLVPDAPRDEIAEAVADILDDDEEFLFILGMRDSGWR